MNEFIDFIRQQGYDPPRHFEPGRFFRFQTNGKRTDKAGYAKLFDDCEGGIVGDFRTGLFEVWQAKRQTPLSEAEHLARREHIARAQREAQAERDRLHDEAAEQAQALWRVCREAQEHPYLSSKGVQAHGARAYRDGLVISGMRCNDTLALSFRNATGELRSLQFIAKDGEKRYLPNGEKSGCYFSIGKPDGTICISEGFATGASIHEATGYAVAIAGDAGNLKPVARALREKFPDAELILCADDDIRTAGNPGLTKATEAAQSVGGRVVVPDFGTDRPDGATDFNDLHQAQGLEAVERAIANTSAPARAEHQPDASNATADDPGATVTLLRGSDTKPEPIRWVWNGFLARGKLHLIAGAPGTGKTTVTLALAATVTIGGRWPDGTRAKVGNVLIWSGEDDVRDTLLPRLLAAGADPARLFFVGDVRADGNSRPFDPSRDMPALECEAAKIGDVRLLIVDPVVNAVSGDSHKNTETRRSLQPVVDLASRLDAVALGVSHFSKGTAGRDPVERVTGSVAFGALPRVVFAAAKTTDEDAPSQRVFVRSKSNIGPDGGGFGYDLEQVELSGYPGLTASRVLWGQALEGTASALLATVEAVEEERTERDEAVHWLEDELKQGPVTARHLQASAKAAGLAWRTVQRAKNALGVKSHREGFGKDAAYIWQLPDSMCATKTHVRHLSESGTHGTHGTHGESKGTRNTEGDTLRTVSPSGSVVAFGNDSEPVEVEI